MTCAPGVLSQLLLKEGAGTLTFTSGCDHPYEFRQESLKQTEEIGGQDFIRGTRYKNSQSVRVIRRAVNGAFTVPLTAYNAAALLKKATGTASTPFVPTNSLTAFSANVDRGIYRWNYHDLYVNRLTFRSEASNPIATITAEVIGKTEVKNSTTFPSTTYLTTAQYVPMVHSGLVVTVDTVGGYPLVFYCESAEFTIDNGIAPLFYNSLTATDVCPQDLTVTASITGSLGNIIGGSLGDDLYSETVGDSGYPLVMTWTYGAVSVAATFPKWHRTRVSPGIDGRQNIMYTATGEALANSSGSIFSIAVDSTP